MIHPFPAGEPRSAASIGIVGGGQLAWMLAREARVLGVELHVQTPDPTDPAALEAASVVVGSLEEESTTRLLAQRAERISFENEWVPLEVLRPLEREGVVFLPDLAALHPLVNKRGQRRLLSNLSLPTPRWAGMEASLEPPAADPEQSDGDSSATARAELEPRSGGDDGDGHDAPPAPRLPDGLTFPVMAKLSQGAYDGKGIQLLEDQAALESHLARHLPEDWLLEERVCFDMELAQVVCRDQAGEVRCFPLVQTQQRDQVCEWVLFPAPVDHAVQAWARNVSISLVTALNYVGVMGIEFFFGPCGLLVNEVAPRVHNSGHLTLEACATNQFAQHVRIIAGLPMGSTEPIVKGALMVNLLGYEAETGPSASQDHQPQRQALAAMRGAHVHWYGKRPRAGRKLGHVTFVLEAEEAREREAERVRLLREVRAVWPWPGLAEGATNAKKIGVK